MEARAAAVAEAAAAVKFGKSTTQTSEIEPSNLNFDGHNRLESLSFRDSSVLITDISFCKKPKSL